MNGAAEIGEKMQKLLIYLDNCCYSRPFDDLTLQKNRLEAHAKIFIQSLVKYKSISLVYSFMSLIEIEDSPLEDVKAYILCFVEENATMFIGKRRLVEIETLADEIMQTGVNKERCYASGLCYNCKM